MKVMFALVAVSVLSTTIRSNGCEQVFHYRQRRRGADTS
jgi:hypothetical protein